MGNEIREGDWELFNLLTEFRRRVRALKLETLSAEPPWIAALPVEDALIARTMLAATRAWAARAPAPVPVAAPAPRTRRKRAAPPKAAAEPAPIHESELVFAALDS